MKINPLEAIDASAEAKAAFAAVKISKNPFGRPLLAVGLHDFIAMQLPIREQILSPWLMTQSLSMIYGWRGVGKTHVSLGVSYAVACGSQFLHWEADKPRRVLLVDGEMPGPALQERFATIITSNEKQPEPGFLTIITPDLQQGAMPDLSTTAGQDAVSEVADRVGAELIVIDNLSCLVRGSARENDAESWGSVSEWALRQRQLGRSVLFIHHSGKNGQQRGTSKREDLLDVVIALRRPSDYDPAEGARFEIHYEKARHLSGSDVEPIEAKLTLDKEKKSIWEWKTLVEETYHRVASLANEGLAQVDIAAQLGINKSNVSRAWHKANEEGLIQQKATDKSANEYRRMSKGE
jgi:hypothetical protein